PTMRRSLIPVSYGLPLLLRVGSTKSKLPPLPSVGGKVLPFGNVTSFRSPPRGPRSTYWPLKGTVCPDLKPLRFATIFPFRPLKPADVGAPPYATRGFLLEIECARPAPSRRRPVPSSQDRQS